MKPIGWILGWGPIRVRSHERRLQKLEKAVGEPEEAIAYIPIYIDGVLVKSRPRHDGIIDYRDGILPEELLGHAIT
jgi:hypothetical protein